MRLLAFATILAGISFGEPARCSDGKSETVLAGQTKSIYWQINLKGRVYLSIRAKAGAGCAYFFWVYYPLGQSKSLGQLCGNVSLELPTIWTAFGATLWSRANVEDVQIVGASNEQVANQFVRIEFP